MSRYRKRPLAAFQGEPGAFSHAAALKLLGSEAAVLPRPAFRDVFESLRSDDVTHAVIPIENTLHGSVHENYDHLLEYGFHIVGETSIRISHQLIALPGVKFGDLSRVYSHPVALNQCRRFFNRFKRLEAIPFYDTAGSVKLLKEKDIRDAAAIASETAASIYGGEILRANIEDHSRNFTRFFLLAKQGSASKEGTGEWKTSLVFSTRNEAGSLFRAMACFALRDLSLTKIESRPLRGKPWEYLFYVDFLGHPEETKARNALSNLAEVTESCKLLGTYRPTG